MAFLGRPDLDLADAQSAAELVSSTAADVIINTAAYTAVDKAEAEPERAFAVNRHGAAAIARVAAARTIPLLHISTDYVFDGRKSAPYVESDATHPLNVYGQSKRAGEEAVLAAHPGALVVRTAWLYSPFGGNFLKTMLRAGAERPLLRVVDDQIGSPTSALDLAAALLDAARQLRRGAPGGIYHLAAAGCTSWHGFAKEIFSTSRKHGGPQPQLDAIRTADYPTAAARPCYSVLDSSAFAQRFGIALPHWTQSVPAIVERVLAAKG